MRPRFCTLSGLNAAKVGLAFLTLTALTVPGFAAPQAAPAFPAALAAPAFQTLPGHIPAAVASARLVSAMGAEQPLSLALTLPLHHQAELQDLLHGLYDPADPRYGQFLTPQQFAARYSPTPEEYSRVIAYAKALGLAVTATHSNRTLLDVSAPAAQVEKAFGLHLRVYQSAADGRYFYAPDAEPQVPASIAPLITAVVGLSSASQWKPHLVQKPIPEISPALDPYAADPYAADPYAADPYAADPSAAPLQTGSGPGGALTPTDIKAAYNLSGVSQNGSGQTLGLFELDGYTASDIASYESAYGLPSVPLQNVLVDGVSGLPSSSNGPAEVTLDIELQAALAPSAAKIYVYEGPNTDTGVEDTYNQIATDNLAKSISTSWGEAENSAPASVRSSENAVFQQMAAQGQSIFAASGDSGAKDNGSSLSVDDPASQPYMVGVGGTSLATNGAGGSYKSETTWNNSIGAGGGGVSTVWPIPSYQSGVVGSAASKGSTSQRNVPDVSLDADPNTGYSIYFGGRWAIYGGTSCAAPLWAAFTALVNQSRAASGSSPLGFANPPIYSLAASGAYASDFHDVAGGSTNGYYPAVTGYDDATGWGSFNGASLLADLGGAAAPPPASPSYQIDAGGSAAGTFVADADASGGTTSSTTAAIDISGVTSPAPQAVYQTERYGNFRYVLPSLTPGASYTLRLHFAEIYWSAAGQRVFNVSVNGSPALTNFDIFAAAGGKNKAVVETVPVTADSSGKVTVTFMTVKDNAKVSGLELTASSTVVPAAPTNLTATAGNAQVMLSWSGSPAAASYNIYRSTTSGSETLLQSGVAGTSYTDTGLTNGTTYFYQVAAVGGGGTSAKSAEASAAPAAPAFQPLQINAGGGASGTFAADADASGGTTSSTTAAIDISGVTSPAPQAVYQSERYGNFRYVLPSLTPGASYTLRLHFAEIYWSAAGQRVFNVSVNGSPALTNFDIFAAAGGKNKAVVETVPVTADATGKITVTFTTVKDNAKVSGLELLH